MSFQVENVTGKKVMSVNVSLRGNFLSVGMDIYSNRYKRLATKQMNNPNRTPPTHYDSFTMTHEQALMLASLILKKAGDLADEDNFDSRDIQ